MISWEERKAKGMAEALAILRARSDGLLLQDLFVLWIEATRDVSQSTRQDVARHTSTLSLSDALHAAGLHDAGDYLAAFEVVEGPIRPGMWLVAILLGRACATVLANSLTVGEWVEGPFWQMEQMGAGEAFKAEFLDALIRDPYVREQLWAAASTTMRRMRDEPGLSFPAHVRDRIGAVEAVEAYRRSPQIEEAWETPLDAYYWEDKLFIFPFLRKLDAARLLGEAASLPHPVFFHPGLDGEGKAHDADIVELLSKAPPAFDGDGTFLSGGMILVRLLDEAAKRLRVLSGQGQVFPLPMADEDRPALQGLVNRAMEFAVSVVKVVRPRPDAADVLRSWMERLVFEGDQRGIWSTRTQDRKGVSVDALGILLSVVSQGGGSVPDWIAWSAQAKADRQMRRVTTALVAVVAPDARDRAAIESLLASILTSTHIAVRAGVESFARMDGPTARFGGMAILALEQPEVFVANSWVSIRPFRERGWRKRISEELYPEVGELLTLWSLAALELSPPEQKPGLLLAVEGLLQDAFQTDSHANRSQFWQTALCRFAHSFGKYHAERPADAQRSTTRLLCRHLTGEVFGDLVNSLTISGLSEELIRDAVADLGLDFDKHLGPFVPTARMDGSRRGWRQ